VAELHDRDGPALIYRTPRAHRLCCHETTITCEDARPIPPPEAELPETREARCSPCQSEEIVPVGQGATGMII
jgi:hypothetical protein